VNFREQFRVDTDQRAIAYANPEDASGRIAVIYGTARIGRLARHNATRLWDDFFSDIWNHRDQIPNSRETFEEWIRKRIHSLSQELGGANEMKIGLAQKFVNLFLKDLWAFEQVPEDVSSLFHIPLDRILLSCFIGFSDEWRSWTKVIARTDERFNGRYSEYLNIQTAFRNYAQDLNGFSVLDFEQLLWHKIQVEQAVGANP
jgi:hypothetical protein